MFIHAGRTGKPGALHSSSLQTNAREMPQEKQLHSHSFIWTCKPQPKLTELIIFYTKRIHQGACCFLVKWWNGDEMEGLTKVICTYSGDFKWANFDKLGKLYSEARWTEVRREGNAWTGFFWSQNCKKQYGIFIQKTGMKRFRIKLDN